MKRDYEIMTNVVEKLANSISESSLNDLFARVYNSAIVDAKVRMDSIQHQIAKDEASLLADYEIIKSNFRGIQSDFDKNKRIIDDFQHQLEQAEHLFHTLESDISTIRSRVLIDGTDRIDYAYEKNGGRVVTGLQYKLFPPFHFQMDYQTSRFFHSLFIFSF